jgi:hypothetical protein
MPADARLAANLVNAQSSTGPLSEAGKTAASKNAVTIGLFTAGALIRPGEESIYAEMKTSLHAELSPATPIEGTLASEILGAIWRLRRCGLVESSFSELDDETVERRQASVDRARAHAGRILYKTIAELRRLQTDRVLRGEILDEESALSALGVSDIAKVLRTRGFCKTNPKSAAGELPRDVKSDAPDGSPLPRVTRDEDLFLRRDHPDRDARPPDAPRDSRFSDVERGIDDNPEPVQIRADPRADRCGMLPNASRKDEGIRAVHGGHVAADVFFRPVTKHIQRETGPAVALIDSA